MRRIVLAVFGTDPSEKIATCGFQAAVLRVPIGTRVTWTNADPYLQHVVIGIGWGRTRSMLMDRWLLFAEIRESSTTQPEISKLVEW